jgi:hypothetical protein
VYYHNIAWWSWRLAARRNAVSEKKDKGLRPDIPGLLYKCGPHGFSRVKAIVDGTLYDFENINEYVVVGLQGLHWLRG